MWCQRSTLREEAQRPNVSAQSVRVGSDQRRRRTKLRGPTPPLVSRKLARRVGGAVVDAAAEYSAFDRSGDATLRATRDTQDVAKAPAREVGSGRFFGLGVVVTPSVVCATR